MIIIGFCVEASIRVRWGSSGGLSNPALRSIESSRTDNLGTNKD
jgi:hypothetical protein